jgi:hypothetical protein
MRSRINSTGRVKINPNSVAFLLDRLPGGEWLFHAEIHLVDLGLPPESLVVVEAYRQSASEWFSFGTVAALGPQAPTALRELDPEGIRFRVKVVEPVTGRLLARVDNIDPAGESGRTELLKVTVSDLGQEPWKTEISSHSGYPTLVLNSRIPNIGNRIKIDRTFQAMVLPSALRQVLLLLSGEAAEIEEEPEGDDWQSKWLHYAESISKVDKPDWSDREGVQRWIDSTCKAFSSKYSFSDALIDRE